MRPLLPLMLTACAGCPHQPAPRPPTLDQLAGGFAVASSTAELLADVVEEPAACVGLSVTRDVARAASLGLSLRRFPALAVDVTACGHDARAVDVPPIVDGVTAGVLLVAGAIVDRADIPCLDRQIALSAIAYVQGASAPILDELRDPDGLVSIPGVVPGRCDTDTDAP